MTHETATPTPPKSGINTYNEKPLHAAIKDWYAGPDDAQEVKLEGYFIDLIQGDLLVEVQTRGFGAIRRKLTRLCEGHAVRLVYPIAGEKWIVTLDRAGQTALSRRKSPRKGAIADLFNELIYLPQLMYHVNFSVEVLLIQEEEVRRSCEPHGRYRKQWVKQERRLLSVLERRLFETPADVAALLPADLPQPFTTRQLAAAMRRPIRLAQKAVYCLTSLDALVLEGKQGRSNLYRRI